MTQLPAAHHSFEHTSTISSQACASMGAGNALIAACFASRLFVLQRTFALLSVSCFMYSLCLGLDKMVL
jgi:hypothetical protein